MTRHGELSHGELAAFEAARGQALYRYAFVLTGRADDAQDLVQSAMLSLLTARRSARIDDLLSYTRRTMTNAWITESRRRNVLRRITPRIATPSHQEHEVGGVELRDQLVRALHELPPRQRAVIALRYLEDLDDQQISATLGCAQATVRSLAARGLARLRSALDTEPAMASDLHQEESS